MSFFGKLEYSNPPIVYWGIEKAISMSRTKLMLRKKPWAFTLGLFREILNIQPWLDLQAQCKPLWMLNEATDTDPVYKDCKRWFFLSLLLYVCLIAVCVFGGIQRNLCQNTSQTKDKEQTLVTTHGKKYILCNNSLGKSINKWTTTAFNNQKHTQTQNKT